jgi:preprotein translocase subunit SecA
MFKVEIEPAPVETIRRKPLEYKAPDPDTIGEINQPVAGSMESEELESDNATKPAIANSQSPTSDNVTTSIRQKGKTIFDRMAEGSAGPVSQAKAGKKVSRNDPCPCGSGKKYKKCCGK